MLVDILPDLGGKIETSRNETNVSFWEDYKMKLKRKKILYNPTTHSELPLSWYMSVRKRQIDFLVYRYTQDRRI